MNKKLYKSKNKKLAGVCAGIAEYFNVDPTLVRIIWAILILAYGTGVAAYIIAAIIMDEAPADYSPVDESNEQ